METGGRATLHYHSTGVVCHVYLPSSSVLLSSLPEDDEPTTESIEINREPGGTGKPYRILVAEDAFLLVTLLQDLFDHLGWEMIGPAVRLVDALQLARHEMIDAALLDVNLDGKMSWEVALVLQERGIPFVFGTGYNVSAVLPENLAGSAVISKPYELSELQQVIQRVIAANSLKSDPAAAAPDQRSVAR
jgi:CheY-like chemotaxis protein